MATNYKKTSVYKNTPLYKDYLGTFVPPISIDTRKMKRRKIEPKYNRRPDLMAYDLYGSAEYWWIIPLLNRSVIKDPLFDFTEGKEVFVPDNLAMVGL